MPLFKAAAPPNSLQTLEVDAMTVVFLLSIAAAIVSVVVAAIQGSTSVISMSPTVLGEIAAGAAVVMILSRSIIAAFTNKGISANIGVLTKVSFYISTYVGVGLTVLAWGTAALASVQGYGSSLGISNADLGKIGAAVALATLIGHGIQLVLQNYGFSAAKAKALVAGVIWESPDLGLRTSGVSWEGSGLPGEYRTVTRDDLAGYAAHQRQAGKEEALAALQAHVSPDPGTDIAQARA